MVIQSTRRVWIRLELLQLFEKLYPVDTIFKRVTKSPSICWLPRLYMIDLIRSLTVHTNKPTQIIDQLRIEIFLYYSMKRLIRELVVVQKITLCTLQWVEIDIEWNNIESPSIDVIRWTDSSSWLNRWIHASSLTCYTSSKIVVPLLTTSGLKLCATLRIMIIIPPLFGCFFRYSSGMTWSRSRQPSTGH